jgi:hypothetical protein
VNDWFHTIMAAFIALVIAIVLMMLTETSQGETKVVCMQEEDRDHILRMSLRAVDQGFQHHVNNLFSNWVLDQAQQPARAQKGMQNGIKARLQAQKDAKAWTPPVC